MDPVESIEKHTRYLAEESARKVGRDRGAAALEGRLVKGGATQQFNPEALLAVTAKEALELHVQAIHLSHLLIGTPPITAERPGFNAPDAEGVLNRLGAEAQKISDIMHSTADILSTLISRSEIDRPF